MVTTEKGLSDVRKSALTAGISLIHDACGTFLGWLCS
jgi:hypothetical protein